LFRFHARRRDPRKSLLHVLYKIKECDTNGVSPLNSNGTKQSDSQTKAEILNNQFVSVFTTEDTNSIPYINSKYKDVQHITVTRNGLQDVNVHMATGPDNISGMMLKSLCEELLVVDILVLIFQTSLDCGRLPKAWKEAFNTPLFKKGDRSKPANYRPVSLTSIGCKLLEHMIHSTVISQLDVNGILNEAQHVFRKKRSCESQLILLVQDLADSLNEGQQVDAILLDFSKAFDKVPHQRLLAKLQHYGVRGQLLEWISDFLIGRTQSVLFFRL